MSASYLLFALPFLSFNFGSSTIRHCLPVTINVSIGYYHNFRTSCCSALEPIL